MNAANTRLKQTRHERLLCEVGGRNSQAQGWIDSLVSRNVKTKSMRLTLHSFKSDVPMEKVCQPGVDYEVFDSEVEPDLILPFFDMLIFPRDRFYLEGPGDYLVDFWKHEDSIWVEITGTDFWATSEVSLKEATAIIDSLHRNEHFGDQIPMTNREWDAYTARDK